MKSICLCFVVASVLTGSVASAATQFEYDFAGYVENPVEGQLGWNIYPKVKDSSACSIVDEVGLTEVVGDKALVILPAKSEIRCVSGDSVRWMPGKTLNFEFDFKVAVNPGEPLSIRPVMEVLVGNSLLSEKSRWNVRLDALPGGDWLLTGSLPDFGSKKIYAENFMIRMGDEVSISNWFHFTLVIKKLNDPDAFESQVKISDNEGNTVAFVEFTDNTKNKVSASMWNLSRLHVGFNAAVNQYGLASVDNMKVSVTE